ncbi:hypothetical protein ACB092_05G169700 [Castanea dentata]
MNHVNLFVLILALSSVILAILCVLSSVYCGRKNRSGGNGGRIVLSGVGLYAAGGGGGTGCGGSSGGGGGGGAGC